MDAQQDTAVLRRPSKNAPPARHMDGKPMEERAMVRASANASGTAKAKASGAVPKMAAVHSAVEPIAHQVTDRYPL